MLNNLCYTGQHHQDHYVSLSFRTFHDALEMLAFTCVQSTLFLCWWMMRSTMRYVTNDNHPIKEFGLRYWWMHVCRPIRKRSLLGDKTSPLSGGKRL